MWFKTAYAFVIFSAVRIIGAHAKYLAPRGNPLTKIYIYDNRQFLTLAVILLPANNKNAAYIIFIFIYQINRPIQKTRTTERLYS